LAKAFLTAIGTAYYPHIAEPDNKYKTYNTGLYLDAKGAALFQEALDDFIGTVRMKTKRPKLPIEEQDDGTFLIRAKSKYQPGVFDSKNKAISKDTPIGGGSKLRLAVEFNHYNEQGEGINLYLKSVQVIELVEGGSSGESPFDEVDDGYEAPEGEFTDSADGEGLDI
jgi:hypothetical protein